MDTKKTVVVKYGRNPVAIIYMEQELIGVSFDLFATACGTTGGGTVTGVHKISDCD
jgi:hypothetical protein